MHRKTERPKRECQCVNVRITARTDKPTNTEKQLALIALTDKQCTLLGCVDFNMDEFRFAFFLLVTS